MSTRWLVAAALLCAAPVAVAQAPARDGARDFDFEFGRWATSVSVLRNPLSGQPPQWADYRGESVVKPLLDGRANFVELKVSGPAGRIEGGSLRLYNPRSGQWSLNYASVGGGVLTAPVYGGFDGGRTGTFFGQDNIDGRTVLVRFVITIVSPAEARFEQAYSADGGKSWELNWRATDRRVGK